MEISNLSLPALNRLATEYLEGTPQILRFFHYYYQSSAAYKERLLELQKRTFMRKKLVRCIADYMEPFPSSTEVRNSLNKLADEKSVAVIGGQQAGIFTGPLYTIHKIISIIVLARQLEAELNVPVVPVFWIAGEDHDFQEVNHIYIDTDGKIEKKVYPETMKGKKMVSDIKLNQKKTLEWAKEIVAAFGETEYTNQLLSLLEEAIGRSSSFTDFFAYLVMQLFHKDGLLIIDSANQGLRNIENDIFLLQLERAEEITNRVKEMQKEITLNGYHPLIELSGQAANLFFHEYDTNERILLAYDPQKKLFIGKSEAVRFSYEELRQTAVQSPERLSNNVVTRPLTQELLFPTIAFIAGPGEIAYWAELKKVFELFSLKMPPIVPRLNITLLDRAIERDVQEFGLSLEEVLLTGTDNKRREFLAAVKDEEVEALFRQTKENLLHHYRLLEHKLDKALLPLLDKNRYLLIQQIEFMEAKTGDFLEEKHENILNKFRRIDNHLRPLGAPQERILNALQYMNRFGLHFFPRLAQLPYSFDGNHKIIRI